MKKQRIIGLLAGCVMLTSAAVATGGVATAAQQESVDSTSEQALVEQAKAADAAGYIIVERADSVAVDGATFYPTGPISDDTLVVIPDPDGSLPDGLTEQRIQSLIEQKRSGLLTEESLTVDAAPEAKDATTLASQYAWSATSAQFSRAFLGGSLIGLNSSTRASYYFDTQSGYGQRAAGNGMGFWTGYNGSQFGTWERFYGVGNAGPAGAGGTVPWGNVAATKKFQARCTVTLACFGKFQ